MSLSRNRYARALTKIAAKDAVPLRSKELLDMHSDGGMLADYFSPAGWGGRRAGRAKSMARAADKDPGFAVKYPVTHQLLMALLGGGAGAAAGAGIGHAVDGDWALPGGFLGGSLGALLGSLGAGEYRRGSMEDIAKRFDEKREAGTLNKDIEHDVPGYLIGALTPFGGAHRKGQTKLIEHLRGREDRPADLSSPANLAYAAHYVPYLNMLSAGLGGALESVDAKARALDSDEARDSKK